MAPAEGAPAIAVEVVYCPSPHVVDLRALQVPAATCAIDALRRSGLLQAHGLAEEGLRIGIWGRACEPQRPLRERDRVEVYRVLQVDPKEARRQRYKGRRQKGG
ncbi:MAG: RnfH family protein [Rubrivivax sp.]